MIIEEYVENGQRIRHYSDENYKIIQNETGILYEDAVDVLPCRYTYTESDIKIEHPDTDAESEDYQNALQRLGMKIDD